MGKKQFRYENLGETAFQIRLLELNRADEQGTVSCQIITTELATAPPYYALSYAWGKERKTKVVVRCNGLPLQVTRTLHVALTYLRNLDRNKYGYDITSRYFWIDQICINQDDATERGRQVQRMRDIYSNAIRTLIWFGEGDGEEHDAEAMRLMDRINDVVQRDFPNAKLGDEIPYNRSGRTIARCVSEAGLPPHDISSGPWPRFEKFCSAHWVLRLWVIQECVSSTLDPLLISGNAICAWSQLYWAATWYYKQLCGLLEAKHQLLRCFWNIQCIGQHRKKKELGYQAAGLEMLMRDTSGDFDCSDGRDLIFGLVGISGDVGETTWPAALLPDYSKPCAIVYLDVARYFLEKEQTLDCLSRQPIVHRNKFSPMHGVSGEDRIPSWCPRWDCGDAQWQKYGASSLLDRIDQDGKSTGVTDWPILLAGKAFASLSFPNQGSLQLRGSVISTIRYTSKIMSSRSDNAKIWEEIVNLSTATQPEALTMAFTSAIHVEQVSPETVRDFCAFLLDETSQDRAELAFFRKWTRRLWVPTGPPTFAMDPHLPHYRANLTWVQRQAEGGSAERYHRVDVRDSFYGRPIILTRDRHIGLGAPGAKKGDILCTLATGRLLYILRPKGSHYEFIGDCYVGELMGDRIEKMVASGELKIQTFDIR